MTASPLPPLHLCPPHLCLDCYTLQAIGKVAGTVAMGMGAAAMLSAFAVDIADVAVLGAVAGGRG